MRNAGAKLCSTLAAVLLCGVWLAANQARAEAPTPQTVAEWVTREHELLRRYLAVLRQAAHDYAYGYKTPTTLMPVALDLFTRYVAIVHDAEEQVLYPALQAHLTPDQDADLALIKQDQQEEVRIVKTWQEEALQHDQGRKPVAEIATTLEELARLVNRHLVLQEQRVSPYLALLSGDEQAETLRQLDAVEREGFGATGRARYERLLAWIEGEVHAIAGRIW